MLAEDGDVTFDARQGDDKLLEVGALILAMAMLDAKRGVDRSLRRLTEVVSP